MNNSFGNYPASHPQSVQTIDWKDQLYRSLSTNENVLPIGLQKSYGDSCLNNGGTLLRMAGMNKIIEFNVEQGYIICEAGITLYEILQCIIPHGWFLPVTPGTKYITLGGAIANDVHGKNHHGQGSFGNHVHYLGLQRSDIQNILHCSDDENVDFFKATIGGLGLTGVIVYASIQLVKIHSTFIDATHTKHKSYAAFLELSQQSELRSEYSVAWFDCFAGSTKSMKGIFSEGNFSEQSHELIVPQKPRISIPIFAPELVLNPLSIRIFNTLFYNKQVNKAQHKSEYFDSFFYPLDAINNWNYMYGKSGFVQYQCVLPTEHSELVLNEILKKVKSSKMGSFLVVLKSFGSIKSKGMLSFPMPGITIAMDFPWREKKTEIMLDIFDDLVDQSGGRVYAAKDSRMKGEKFRKWYPNYEQFLAYKDPKMHSTFWERIMK